MNAAAANREIIIVKLKETFFATFLKQNYLLLGDFRTRRVYPSHLWNPCNTRAHTRELPRPGVDPWIIMMKTNIGFHATRARGLCSSRLDESENKHKLFHDVIQSIAVDGTRKFVFFFFFVKVFGIGGHWVNIMVSWDVNKYCTRAI